MLFAHHVSETYGSHPSSQSSWPKWHISGFRMPRFSVRSCPSTVAKLSPKLWLGSFSYPRLRRGQDIRETRRNRIMAIFVGGSRAIGFPTCLKLCFGNHSLQTLGEEAVAVLRPLPRVTARWINSVLLPPTTQTYPQPLMQEWGSK